jgi:hypothetical protein
MRTYKGLIQVLPPNGVFVFGSNTQGIHGAGSAKVAYTKFGAQWGNSEGPQGDSYAIATKDLTKKIHPSVSVQKIVIQIKSLYYFAEAHPHLDFYIPYKGSGTNLNHYHPAEMAIMFDQPPIPENIIFEESFAKLITNGKDGTNNTETMSAQ